MTPNEIILFFTGLLVGANLVAVWHAVLDMREARRSLAESHQVRRRAAGDAYLRSLELYRVQQRYGLVP
ncbi:hypothetical protein DKG34_38725 [Streptomyces sp. NWU49]|uniref:hypothetical protein n=1 Tax=Streptomyces sp. NWU49 TaxID=2201153 RepID=UPI000D67F365|nr:hypothetical protein [Streptomyces sp. NWU49]PWJ02413.1 hypothetical protein DKG34_38725 [Streptomyces sp. NWU49]